MAPKTEVAPKTTFTTDDKRAQYARLTVFNFAVKEKLVKKSEHDVNSCPDSILAKAADSLAGGNLLDGKDGIEFIQAMTKDGATDENVAKRGLTTAYAQEVRPFIRRKTLSETFGRRAKPVDPAVQKAKDDAAAAKEKAKAEKAAAKEKAAKDKKAAQEKAAADKKAKAEADAKKKSDADAKAKADTEKKAEEAKTA